MPTPPANAWKVEEARRTRLCHVLAQPALRDASQARDLALRNTVWPEDGDDGAQVTLANALSTSMHAQTFVTMARTSETLNTMARYPFPWSLACGISCGQLDDGARGIDRNQPGTLLSFT